MAGLPQASCTAVLVIKPWGVLILCDGTALLIHPHPLICDNHQMLWAELVLGYLFLHWSPKRLLVAFALSELNLVCFKYFPALPFKVLLALPSSCVIC